MRKFINGLVTGLGVLGSTFIKKTSDGKYEVAVAPLMLAAVMGSGVTCAVQNDEPFGVCLKSTLAAVKEVINAN